MRLATAVGWMMAPFVMLPARWSKLSATSRLVGAVWSSALLLSLLALAMPHGAPSNPAQQVQAKVVPAAASPAAPATPDSDELP
ncbi:hypothetical protein ACTHPH_09620 [Paenibacillus pasadenensis]|uniref:Uncharacterized protein n=1 Tax=Paenibacillus pasadenensis TaxID=217090 RepID=A0A2N5N7W1_9BACL|nr:MULTISPECIES: hypothetical protein [Paenibacillus]PLT46413.1 hypothetical protein B8V81_4844 [Paenibacillus pasadenensis]QGG56848.1 hypothetical protein GE073_15470 [Paenibacillus sp. B01]